MDPIATFTTDHPIRFLETNRHRSIKTGREVSLVAHRHGTKRDASRTQLRRTFFTLKPTKLRGSDCALVRTSLESLFNQDLSCGVSVRVAISSGWYKFGFKNVVLMHLRFALILLEEANDVYENGIQLEEMRTMNTGNTSNVTYLYAS
jgi:hypothetical protein